MPDLTLAQLKKAYDAALEQIAAESFLDPRKNAGTFYIFKPREAMGMR